MDTEKIQIRAPRFELYERVTLYWNGQERLTHIVRRWFDLDDSPRGDGPDGYWWYKVTNDEQLYPEGTIEPRNV